MIEAGEAVHYIGVVWFLVFLAFLIGTQFGSKNAQKNTD